MAIVEQRGDYLIDQIKKANRKLASQNRQQLHHPDAAKSAANHFLNALDLTIEKSVSLYWPLGSELDTRPLLEQLNDRNIACLLPVVEEKNRPLVFKEWKIGDPLCEGAFGVLEPKADAKTEVPDILIVPMLSFDAQGYRLGYGGGFYDRTLQSLRQNHNSVAVGFAYSGQEVGTVTIDKYDQRLDWVVTEKEARKIK